MYIRKVKSRNSTCFQIGKKQSGRFVLVKHIGCARDSVGIEVLRLKSETELTDLILKDQLSLLPVNNPPRAKLLSWQITGYHQVFGSVYDSIGFPNNLLRDLVIARIVHPKSKTATIRFLNHSLGINLTKDKVFRFADTLSKDELAEIAFNFVSKRHGGISLLFYDVTTLYFETENEDDFRKKGFSKNHRSNMPQILIGLFVDSEGYPFDFDFFKGNTFEGHTFKSAINSIIGRYAFFGIDINQIEKDKRYDGLKGYITDRDNKSTASEVIKQYHNLWKVEKAFRMSKSDLRERPVYHRRLDRIKSHLIICFVSLLVLKETETILRRIHYSLEKTIELLGRIGQGKTRTGKIILDTDSELSKEAQEILKLFEGH